MKIYGGGYAIKKNKNIIKLYIFLTVIILFDLILFKILFDINKTYDKEVIKICMVILQFYLFIIVHEVGHFIIYAVNKIDISYFYIFPFEFNMENSKMNKSFGKIKPYMGLVIPEVNEINDENYADLRKTICKSLILGPAANFIAAIICLCGMNYNDMFMYGLFINVIMVIMCLSKNEYVYGDFYAYKYIKESEMFYLRILYSYCEFSKNEHQDINKKKIAIRLDELIRNDTKNDNIRELVLVIHEEIRSEKSFITAAPKAKIDKIYERYVLENRKLLNIDAIFAENMIIYYLLNNNCNNSKKLFELINYNSPNWYNDKEKELIKEKV